MIIYINSVLQRYDTRLSFLYISKCYHSIISHYSSNSEYFSLSKMNLISVIAEEKHLGIVCTWWGIKVLFQLLWKLTE